MQHITINGVSHSVGKNVNILLNQHTKDDHDGEVFCRQCKCVWPCPTRILISGYAELIKEKYSA